MIENVIKKLFPIRDEKGQPCTFPTFASQVFFDDGSVLEGKEFGSGGSIDPLTIYPVGSIYMSVNETSPASLFGGTWEQMKDRFLLGAGDSYAAGSEGGKASVTINPENLPSRILAVGQNNTGSEMTLTGFEEKTITKANGAWPAATINVLKSKGIMEYYGAPVDNMPPYLSVYMWKRVS